MTDEMPKVTAHWRSLGLRFDAVYSGFLGSERQIGIVEEFIRTFRRENTAIVVDPVMGDHGRCYQTYTPAMCAGMVFSTTSSAARPPIETAILAISSSRVRSSVLSSSGISRV